MKGLLHSLLPPVRAEAFRILFGPDGREMHLRELCRSSKLGLGPWQRELAKLEQLDLVHSRRDGNRRAFRANQEHPAYRAWVALVAKTSGIKEVLADALQGTKGIRVAFIFGSLAAGTAKGSSDVDLMVIGEGIGLRDISPFLRAAVDTIGREINAIVMSPSEFLAKLKDGNAFLANVMAAERLYIVGGTDELGAMG
jgi:predicted nucleotidyltransferase